MPTFRGIARVTNLIIYGMSVITEDGCWRQVKRDEIIVGLIVQMLHGCLPPRPLRCAGVCPRECRLTQSSDNLSVIIASSAYHRQ